MQIPDERVECITSLKLKEVEFIYSYFAVRCVFVNASDIFMKKQ